MGTGIRPFGDGVLRRFFLKKKRRKTPSPMVTIPVPIGLLLCYNEQEGGKKWSILSLVQPGI